MPRIVLGRIRYDAFSKRFYIPINRDFLETYPELLDDEIETLVRKCHLKDGREILELSLKILQQYLRDYYLIICGPQRK